jgi:hypothetical protein
VLLCGLKSQLQLILMTLYGGNSKFLLCSEFSKISPC